MHLKVSRKTLLALLDPIKAALRPPPRQSLWEWAESSVVLTPKTGTFAPGRYRTRHTPHVRGVMEAFQDPDVREVVLAFSAQSGKTLTETICAAWTIANDPGNSLFVMPSEQMAKSFSATRLQRVIEDTPDVAAHRVPGKGKFNLLEMEFDNSVFALAGAGSASNLASRPIRYAYLDELDKYPPALGDEGSPATLALERTKTFSNYKAFETSTVTTEQGPIWLALLSSERHEWFCPCPECGFEFVVEWARMTFPKDGTDDERAEACRVVCPSCGASISEGGRRAFVTSGRWVKTSDGPSSRQGFRISELASGIGRPWPVLVRMFIKAARAAKTGYTEDLKTFVCSVLAEPWKEDSDTMRGAEGFLQYRDGYARGVVPSYMPVTGLTMGVDTQDNGFYYVVRAWGGGDAMESWLVDHGFAEDFSVLESVLTAEWRCEDGTSRTISGAFIDSQGHRTPDVYRFCRAHRLQRIVPTKGERQLSGGLQYTYKTIDRDPRGRLVAGGLQLCHINTTLFKNWLDGKLRLGQDDPGAWHVHDDIDSDYCLQMASEYRTAEGYWRQRGSNTPNHYWDCEVLALARAASLRFDRARAGARRESRPAATAGEPRW